MLAGLKAGREVEINIRGRVFWATLLARTSSGWNIQPPRGISYHHVTTQQIRTAAKQWSPEDTQRLG
jgi:hypothetical protein